jgi:hypothetical protein
MANHDGPSLARAVEWNPSGLTRRLKAAANVLDAHVAPPPKSGCLANLICCSADPNKQCRLTEAYPPRFEQGEEDQRGVTTPASGPSYPTPGQA